jgi:pimeloyl-ACP methyl ester carboxylesterase
MSSNRSRPTPGAPRRRALLAGAAGCAALAACGSPPAVRVPEPPMDVAAFHGRRRFARTPSGEIAYVEQGQGPVALFLHGVPLNGFHWRHVMARLQNQRRCIALDLMGLGYTRIGRTQDVSFTAQARMVREFIDATDIDRVDLVTNDSGGGIGQVFAAYNAERLRSLTLTNCDVHTNWPPDAIAAAIDAARQGTLLDFYVRLIEDRALRRQRLSSAWANVDVLTDEVYRVYIDPLRATPETRSNFHRYWMSFDNAQTRAIESRLRTLQVPTLVVWALDDIYFDVKWAHWLRDTIPGVRRVVEVPGAKLFFPEDRPEALVNPLLEFWARTGIADPREAGKGS